MASIPLKSGAVLSDSEEDNDEVTMESLDKRVRGVTELIHELDIKLGGLTKITGEVAEQVQGLTATIATNNAVRGGSAAPTSAPAQAAAARSASKRECMNSATTIMIPISRGVYRSGNKDPAGPGVVIDTRRVASILATLFKLEDDIPTSIESIGLIYRDSHVTFRTGVGRKDAEYAKILGGYKAAIEMNMNSLINIGKEIQAMKNVPPSMFTVATNTPQAVKDIVNRIADLIKKPVVAAEYPRQPDWLAALFNCYIRSSRPPFVVKKDPRDTDKWTCPFLSSALGIAWLHRLSDASRAKFPMPGSNETLDLIIPENEVPK
jgi:hypothetical protein